MMQIALILCMAQAYEAILIKDGEKNANAFKEAIEWKCPDTGKVNIDKENREYLSVIVAAIRYAENGGQGKEYGILHPRANTYRKQAGWCAKTVSNKYKAWKELVRKGKLDDGNKSFLIYLGSKYAPIGADNDPHGLNKNWVPNVQFYQKKIVFGDIKKPEPILEGRIDG